MAGNSAQVKTWTVSLVTAVFVFAGLSDERDTLIGVAGFVPVLLFGAMDARYLHLERCYRSLYEAIVEGKPVKPFDLDYRPYAGSVGTVGSTAWSWSVAGFYLALSILLVVLLVILAY
ncbi:MAG: hypothetical protein OXP07_23825 [Defluviicoccus sp.]|nr:hypothetical protein [Defluviicoccus sp.]